MQGPFQTQSLRKGDAPPDIGDAAEVRRVAQAKTDHHAFALPCRRYLDAVYGY